MDRVALLVVTCPCALSLATPVAISSATGAVRRLGMLVTRGHALEMLPVATPFVFDKTGTLTRSKMARIGAVPLAGERRERCLACAARLEARSEAVMGRVTVADAGPARPVEEVARAINLAGRGLEAHIGGGA